MNFKSLILNESPKNVINEASGDSTPEQIKLFKKYFEKKFPKTKYFSVDTDSIIKRGITEIIDGDLYRYVQVKCSNPSFPDRLELKMKRLYFDPDTDKEVIWVFEQKTEMGDLKEKEISYLFRHPEYVEMLVDLTEFMQKFSKIQFKVPFKEAVGVFVDEQGFRIK